MLGQDQQFKGTAEVHQIQIGDYLKREVVDVVLQVSLITMIIVLQYTILQVVLIPHHLML